MYKITYEVKTVFLTSSFTDFVRFTQSDLEIKFISGATDQVRVLIQLYDGKEGKESDKDEIDVIVGLLQIDVSIVCLSQFSV